jgi:hypothetical protein
VARLPRALSHHCLRTQPRHRQEQCLLECTYDVIALVHALTNHFCSRTMRLPHCIFFIPLLMLGALVQATLSHCPSPGPRVCQTTPDKRKPALPLCFQAVTSHSLLLACLPSMWICSPVQLAVPVLSVTCIQGRIMFGGSSQLCFRQVG